MNLAIRPLLSAAAALAAGAYTAASAIENGLCSDPAICGLGLLAALGVADATILAYTRTPGPRTLVRRAILRGRPAAGAPVPERRAVLPATRKWPVWWVRARPSAATPGMTTTHGQTA
jgi:hypothetical protein